MPIPSVANGDQTLSPRPVPGFLELMSAAYAASRMIGRVRDTLVVDPSYSRHSSVSAALQTYCTSDQRSGRDVDTTWGAIEGGGGGYIMLVLLGEFSS